MHAAVVEYISSGGKCQRNKSSTQRPRGLLQPLTIPEGTWESVSMDLITQLPQSKDGHDAILAFVDRLSKMTHFAPTITSVSAEGIACMVLHNVVRLRGIPLEFVNDRATCTPRRTSCKACASLWGSSTACQWLIILNLMVCPWTDV